MWMCVYLCQSVFIEDTKHPHVKLELIHIRAHIRLRASHLYVQLFCPVVITQPPLMEPLITILMAIFLQKSSEACRVCYKVTLMKQNKHINTQHQV